ncbi:MAG: hypothetical protein F4155_09690 [Acidimicrobiales bacterium]|nr:hypothetical protein [Acidimicrobiales bacterium]MYH75057.1 hypothetical protein [Acidimicrobiales bacterium]MYK70077.1 hypothetical protein [Acidimicrobiales bacterium]
MTLQAADTLWIEDQSSPYPLKVGAQHFERKLTHLVGQELDFTGRNSGFAANFDVSEVAAEGLFSHWDNCDVALMVGPEAHRPKIKYLVGVEPAHL